MTRHRAVISVDVEDWPQSTFDRTLPITDRAKRNTLALLERLERLGVRATLFVLGRFAEAYPEVVREISAAGHEIGSHGYSHVEVFRQSPGVFKQEARRSKQLLEDLIGKPVSGYRAGDFSIVRTSLRALDILADLGFVYDSSIYPVRASRYGIAEWPIQPVRVRTANGREIVEFPITAAPCCGRNWPVAGGGYLRLLPSVVFNAIAARVLKHWNFVFYCHPYEFDARELFELDLPISWKTKLHQSLGRSRFGERFDRFASAFPSITFSELLGSLDTKSMPVIDRPAFV